MIEIAYPIFRPFQYVKYFEKCKQELRDRQSQRKQLKVFETSYLNLTRFRQSGFSD